MHKMTSQNICRNIHPVFVVLLAVSKYEIRIQNSRIIDKIYCILSSCFSIQLSSYMQTDTGVRM